MKNNPLTKLLHALFVAGVTFAPTYAQKTLLPQPQKIVIHQGAFKSTLTLNQKSSSYAEMVRTSGIQLAEKGKELHLSRVSTLPGVEMNLEEAYKLHIEEERITLEATTEKGLFWGLQSLSQLQNEYPKGDIPCLEILDWPAFKVRGWMQDVGRSYVSMEELKEQIATLAKYKINLFHWHLTENQAWRLESKVHPELVAAKNMTRMEGKYYSHEEAKELQAFCKQHNMILLPEFDMPGHSAAFKRAFGVDMQTAEGIKILKELINEVCEVFDEVPYLHIGTDEVHFTNPTFCDEMVAFIRERGKKVISWNPGWNYKAGEIDMTQMWSYRGKPTPGVPAIDSKFHYLNHFDTFADIVALYTSRIGNVAKGSDQIAGTILALWHDRYMDKEEHMNLENYLYPNMLAIAERAWLGGGYQYYDQQGTNLVPGTEPFEAFKNFEKRLLWQKKTNFAHLPFAYVKQTDVKWNITDQFPNEGDLSKSFEPENELKPSYQWNDETIGVNEAIGGGIYLRHVWGEKLIPGFYQKPLENHTAYAWTYVYSKKKQEVGLWFETQNYSRSESDLAPLQGTWDYRESKIWLNDQEVAPPTWSATHTKRSNEIPLGNENMVGRSPQRVQLNKGWNKVLIKLPIGKFSVPQVRLTKWMFAAMFVTMDGKERIELIYSPDKKK
ncbi:MAG: family 20 glycosylhydrolase [Phocaeicola sp.]